MNSMHIICMICTHAGEHARLTHIHEPGVDIISFW